MDFRKPTTLSNQDRTTTLDFKASFFTVPKWISEGRCNMGLFMHNGAGDVGAKTDEILINRIEYFPHNDTLNAIYRCSNMDDTRVHTCTFSDNVG